MERSSFLAKFDLYRRVPKDLSQGSSTGGAVSLLALFLCSLVVILEVYSLLSVDHASFVELDHSSTNNIHLNFNVTLHELSCDFATIEVKDVFSDKARIVSMYNVNKFTPQGFWEGTALNSAWIDFEKRAKDQRLPEYLKVGQNAETPAETEDKDAIEDESRRGKDLVKELNHVSFDPFIEQNEIAFVVFYAPWCRMCQDLDPIFNRASFLTDQLLKNLPENAPMAVKEAAKSGKSIKFARLDCTTRAANAICKEQNVQGYPHIQIYGDSESMVNHNSGFHVYNGKRTGEAISSHALLLLHLARSGAEAAETLEKKGGSSMLRFKGCRVEGAVPVNKVPTQLIIRAKSDFHQLNTSLFTMDHTIHHLSAGKMLPEFRPVSPHENDPEKIKKRNEASRRHLESIRGGIEEAFKKAHGTKSVKRVGKSALLKNDESLDFKKGAPMGFDHFVRVVPITLLSNFGHEDNEYDFTFQTNEQSLDYGEVPQVAFKVEVSSLRLILEEQSKSLSGAFVNIMALVGGIFSSFILLEGFVSSLMVVVGKKRD